MATFIDLQSLFHGQTHQFQPIIYISSSLDYKPKWSGVFEKHLKNQVSMFL